MKLGKIRLKIMLYLETLRDIKNYDKYSGPEGQTSNGNITAILLLVHSLEKGMCSDEPRPFGFSKINSLLNELSYFENRDGSQSTAYDMGVSILFAWLEFYKEKKWTNDKQFMTLEKKINEKYSPEDVKVTTGNRWVSISNSNAFKSYEGFMKSRFSARKFQKRKIEIEDLEKAIRIAQYSPSACNRQMVNVHIFATVSARQKVHDFIQGNSELNFENTTYLIITYDTNLLGFYGERNQGNLNAGIFAANLSNALHSLSIGSCFLQMANLVKEEQVLKRSIGIPENENISIILSAGYYLEDNLVPISVRKKLSETLFFH